MEKIKVEGKYNTIYMADPCCTYYIATYKDKEIKSESLLDTGWKDLPDGILKLTYYLSTGTVIEIPAVFDAYLHLVEVSRSVLSSDVVYHYLFIKCKKGPKVISYRINLKEDDVNHNRIGDLYLSEELFKDNPYWKQAEVLTHVGNTN
jgi:hypothetical protein